MLYVKVYGWIFCCLVFDYLFQYSIFTFLFLNTLMYVNFNIWQLRMKFLKVFGLTRKKDKTVQETVGFTSEVGLCHHVEEESDGTYILRSAEDMYWLARMVNENGCNFSGRTIRLAADIDFKGMPWIPAGRKMEKPFCGIFDGCGHVLSGIQIEGNEKYAGLFGVISGVDKILTAEVYNLRLSSVSVRSANPGASVGGIAGFAYEGVRIEKCFVGGLVEGGCNTGGIAGRTEDCVTIRRCGIRGKVGGGEQIGAIVGKMDGNSTVINCNNAAMDLLGRPEDRLVGVWDETSMVR